MRDEDLWSSYWRRGAQPSSVEGFPPAVRAAIEERWLRTFARLPNRARMLDLATGIGALPALAARAMDSGRSLAVIGTDLAADIDPTAIPERSGFSFRFQGGIDSAHLPFPDRNFDLVVSQFGIEYGAFTAALAEAARVARGPLVLLIHARDGSVVRQNAAIAGQIAWLLDDLDLIGRLRAYLAAPGAQSGASLTAAASAMAARGRGLENHAFLEALTRDVGHFLQSQAGQPPTVGLARVDALEAALRNHGERMAALGQAGLDDEQLDAAATNLQRLGFSRVGWEPERSADGRHLVGYWLEAHHAS